MRKTPRSPDNEASPGRPGQEEASRPPGEEEPRAYPNSERDLRPASRKEAPRRSGREKSSHRASNDDKETAPGLSDEETSPGAGRERYTPIAAHVESPMDIIVRVVNLILLIGTIFVLTLFGLITFTSFVDDLVPAVFSTQSLVWKFTIVTYFTSWLGGVNVDIRREGKIYHPEEKPGPRVDRLSWSLTFVIFVLFGIMYFIEDIQADQHDSLLAKFLYYTQLQDGMKQQGLSWIKAHGPLLILALINFLWFFNIFLWRWLVEYFTKDLSRESRLYYKSVKDYFGIVKVDLLDRYLDGNWQWRRYISGIVFLLFIDLFFIPSMFGNLDQVVDPKIPPALCATFVAVFETWIWLERLRVGFSIRNLDTVAKQYSLRPRAT